MAHTGLFKVRVWPNPKFQLDHYPGDPFSPREGSCGFVVEPIVPVGTCPIEPPQRGFIAAKKRRLVFFVQSYPRAEHVVAVPTRASQMAFFV